MHWCLVRKTIDFSTLDISGFPIGGRHGGRPTPILRNPAYKFHDEETHVAVKMNCFISISSPDDELTHDFFIYKIFLQTIQNLFGLSIILYKKKKKINNLGAVAKQSWAHV